MTLDVREATDADRPAWSAFIASRPEGDILQSWAWGAASQAEPDESWSRLVVVDGGGRIRGIAQILARRTSFGRTIQYIPHGPVWDRDGDDAAEVMARLLVAVRDHGRALRGVVLKLDPRASDDATATAAVARALISSGVRPSRHDLQAPTTRVVDLTEGDDVIAGWTKDGRAELRRAEREGVVTSVDRAAGSEAIDRFHALLVATAEGQGFRIRSRAFLGRLAEELAPAGEWYLATAEHDGVPLAGAIVPRAGERAFYLYAASTRDREAQKKRGPYAAMAAVERALREDGVRTLDLWGVREPDDTTVDESWEGFSRFKRRFGGTSLRHTGTFDLVLDARWHRLREWRERLRDVRG